MVHRGEHKGCYDVIQAGCFPKKKACLLISGKKKKKKSQYGEENEQDHRLGALKQQQNSLSYFRGHN